MHLTQIPQAPLDPVGHSSYSDIDCKLSRFVGVFPQIAQIETPGIPGDANLSYFLSPFHLYFGTSCQYLPNETSGHFLTISEMIEIEYFVRWQRQFPPRYICFKKMVASWLLKRTFYTIDSKQHFTIDILYFQINKSSCAKQPY